VCNLDYCYFEQDFFYLSCDATTGAAVLRELRTDDSHTSSSSSISSSSSGTATTSHHKQGAGSTSGSSGSAAVSKHMPVDRRGIFRLQTTDADMLGALREQVRPPLLLVLEVQDKRCILHVLLCMIAAHQMHLYQRQCWPCALLLRYYLVLVLNYSMLHVDMYCCAGLSKTDSKS
jgi:hypothetical protein